MRSAQNKGIGRTQWDLLVELAQSRTAIVWLAVIAWVIVAGAVYLVVSGHATLAFNAARSPLEKTRCKISIISPAPGESVTPPFTLHGVSDPPPEGYELWVFTTVRPGSQEEYWPIAPSEVTGGRWSVKVSSADWTAGQTKHYAVFIVGKDGQALIRCYKRVMNALSPPGAKWLPLEETTSDMVKCVGAYAVQSK